MKKRYTATPDKPVEAVTVDCVIFGFSGESLKVLLIHSSAGDFIDQ
jgi:hypothetical protein